jgi:hypothetical protein
MKSSVIQAPELSVADVLKFNNWGGKRSNKIIAQLKQVVFCPVALNCRPFDPIYGCWKFIYYKCFFLFILIIE